MKTFLILLLTATLFPISATAVDPASFFDQHCVRCHGNNKQQGNLRLDNTISNAELWLEIAKRIELGEMPPEEEPRPPMEGIKAMVNWAKKNASNFAQKDQVVLRRLNRRQYRNTLRDLLKIDTLVEDPADAFPADDEKDGLTILASRYRCLTFCSASICKLHEKQWPEHLLRVNGPRRKRSG